MDLEALESFKDLLDRRKSLFQTNEIPGFPIMDYYEQWSTMANTYHECLLNGVQIIDCVNYNGRLFYKYEGIVFNLPKDIKNVKIRIQSPYLEPKDVKVVIILIKDTFVHFMCCDAIDPTLYEFKLMYDNSEQRSDWQRF